MKQKELYLKDITRHIEGVIKADDEEFLLQEVEEYVVTKEVEKHLGSFFQEYVKKTFNESVWISGFFGSGKSHLLKMLSLVLGNRAIDGTRCGEVFASKIESDFELAKNIKKALTIPTESLLFNIAVKADGIGHTSSIDPILAVFLKVFNEHLGYFGQVPVIAEIERSLDEDGVYEKFKQLYKKHFNRDWYNGRNRILLNRNEFAKPFAELKKISEEDAKKYFEDVRTQYRLDIDGYVKLIKAYIAKKQSGFRLAFCVDEVGQFIADDVRLMLSLQTLAEALFTQCKGQAFLIVTSQNDLNATIGELEKQQAHDFSRIQARFPLKVPLTSSNADEVIQKRLLAKNRDGAVLLSGVYEKDKNNFRTLFEFGDNSRMYGIYRTEEHFKLTYPFIPYQFELFQASIKALSEHNAFMGKHQSVGERSMLGVFQQVAKQKAEEDVKEIVQFSQMFDGIRDILQSNIQSDILAGEKNLSNPLAVEVLKALFLIKYVKGFNATVKNITILLIPSFEVDLATFQKSVLEALNLLENQTYIQRVGDTYEYLTNQEKDVENEIKNTDIDPKAPGELLSDFLFNEILRDNKVKLDANNQSYEYGKKIDDNLIGRERDFYVNFITPLNANEITTSNVAMMSIGKTDLVVHLSQDRRLYEELRLIIKTEKYVQTTTSPNLDPTKSRILGEKAQHNTDRKRLVINRLKELVGDAPMYLNGSELTDIGSRNPKTRISLGVQQLIRTTYTNLKMLNVEFTEDHLKKILWSQDDVLFKDTMSEIEQEVLNRINRNRAIHERTTTKALLEFFSARPYGWYQAAILCLVAKLYKRNKISLKLEGNTLNDKGVLEALQSNREYGNTIIDVEEDISGSKLKKLKDFHQEYFSEPNLGNEPKEVSRLFKIRATNEVKVLEELYAQRSRYPFLADLGEPLNRLRQVAEKEHPYFFNALEQYSDDLLHDKESVIDGIKKFMGGSQKDIYDSVVSYVENEKANFSYIDKTGLAPLLAVKENATPYKGSVIQTGKQALDAIRSEVSAKVDEERKAAISVITEAVDKLKAFAEYQKLNATQQTDLLQPFNELISEINGEKYIGNLRAKKVQADGELYHKQIDRLMQLAAPPVPTGGTGTPEKKKVYVRKDSVKVGFSKPALETVEDVEAYVKALKDELLKLIKEDKRISL